MKKIFIVISIFFAYISFVSGDEVIKKSAVVKNSDQKNLILIGKNAIVNCSVNNYIISVGGSLDIRGRVGKDVISFFSDIKLGEDAVIKGDILLLGGNLISNKSSRIKGKIHYVNISLKKINSSVKFLSLGKGAIKFLKIIFAIISLIIALFVFAIVPEKITISKELLGDNFIKISTLGIITVILSFLLTLCFIILSFILIGIPLLIAEMIFLIIIMIFGRTVMYYYLGKTLINLTKLQIYSPGIFILTGAFIYLLIYYILIIGFILLKLFTIIELGIGMGFILRNKLNLTIKA